MCARDFNTELAKYRRSRLRRMVIEKNVALDRDRVPINLPASRLRRLPVFMDIVSVTRLVRGRLFDFVDHQNVDGSF